MEDSLSIFTLIGCAVVAICIAKISLRLRRFFTAHFTAPAVDFKQLGRYAVVTGATDGIGKAYAFELAKYGMDIVLVSRTLSRLESTAAELKSQYPNIDVKIVVADFSRVDIYEQLERDLADLDIGLLFNNVGDAINPMNRLTQFSREDLLKMININMTSVVLTSHIVLKKMAEKKRGVVINNSSGSAILPPVYVIYATSKAFVRRFSYGLRLQYGSLGIIVQDLEPFFVTTKLARNAKGFSVVTPEICAKQGLMTIGHYDETHGAIVHEIMGLVLSLFPEFLFCRYIDHTSKKIKEQLDREKLKAQKAA